MKDINLHEKIFKSYQRNHFGEYFLDVEEGKIKTQKINIDKSNKEINNIKKSIVKNFQYDDKNIEEIELLDIENNRWKSKSHKNRLKELKKNDKFN